MDTHIVNIQILPNRSIEVTKVNLIDWSLNFIGQLTTEDRQARNLQSREKDLLRGH